MLPRTFESFEPRRLLATFQVTSTDSTGPGSLAQAIIEANNSPGADSIAFDLAASEPGHVYYRDDGVPAVAMLDQRICCGVGNVYKSEVLHLERLAPQTPVAEVPTQTRRSLVTTAHVLLRRNLGGGPRQTVPGGLAVYGLAGELCRRCGSTIQRIVQGEHARSTYWCPGCQLGPVADTRADEREHGEQRQ